MKRRRPAHAVWARTHQSSPGSIAGATPGDEDIEEITSYLTTLDTQLALLGGRRRRRIVAEVEDHLLQATEVGASGGSDRRTAAMAAIARFGPPSAVAGRVVGSHWAVRAEALRRAHPVWTRALFALACGVVAGGHRGAARQLSDGHAVLYRVGFGLSVAAGVLVVLLVSRPFVTRAVEGRLDAGRSGPDQSPLEAFATLAGAAAVPLLAMVVLSALGHSRTGLSDIVTTLAFTTVAVTLPGLLIVMSGGGTPWQVRLRSLRLQHPWAWGATWGGLTVLSAPGSSSFTMRVVLPAATAVAAMHGYHAIQAAADHLLRPTGP